MLVIIDKDGTLVEPASGDRFVQCTDQQLLPGVAERIAELKAMGATIVIASNQGGVAAGHKSLADAVREMQYALKLMPEVEYAYFCPDYAGEESYYIHQSEVDASPAMAAWCVHTTVIGSELIGTFRKPEAGMLKAAMAVYPMLKDAVMIGDRPEDQQAAAAAGIPFVDAEAWRSGEVSIVQGAFIA